MTRRQIRVRKSRGLRVGQRIVGGAILLLVAWMVVVPSRSAYAQCGLPGTPPCPPAKPPTKTPTRRPARTPTPSETATPTPTDTLAPTATATPAACDTHNLTAILTGANEVPSVVTEGQGKVTLLLDVTSSSITGNWSITSLAGFITAAHIHNGPAGVNAGVFIAFTGLPPGGGSFATVNSAPVPKLQDVLANPPGFYVNVHTNAHPGGEIRGQLACAPAEPVASPTPKVTSTPEGGAGGGGSPLTLWLGLGVLGLGGAALLIRFLGQHSGPMKGGKK